MKYAGWEPVTEERRHVYSFNGSNPKTSFAAIATVTAAGDKLPLWMITNDKVKRCERKKIQNIL
jgi:hypothetical protein